MTTAKLKQAVAFRESNLEAARIIAADPERYPAGSLLAVWAELVLNPPAERQAAVRMTAHQLVDTYLEATGGQA